MAGVFAGEKTLPLLERVETLAYRLAGIDDRREMGWKRYLGALSVFRAECRCRPCDPDDAGMVAIQSAPSPFSR